MLEPTQGQRRILTERRWLKPAVIVSLLTPIVPAAGVHLADYLFPQPVPRLEETAQTLSDARLDALEAQVDLLVRLFNGRGGDAPDKRLRVPTRPRWDFSKGGSGEPVGTEEHAVTVENTSTYLGRKAYVGQRGWEWTIYVTAEDKVLARIISVTYTLHPTFAQRVHRVDKQGTGHKAFPLTLRGWGTFIVDVGITFKDGTTQHKAHQLVFVPGD